MHAQHNMLRALDPYCAYLPRTGNCPSMYQCQQRENLEPGPQCSNPAGGQRPCADHHQTGQVARTAADDQWNSPARLEFGRQPVHANDAGCGCEPSNTHRDVAAQWVLRNEVPMHGGARPSTRSGNAACTTCVAQFCFWGLSHLGLSHSLPLCPNTVSALHVVVVQSRG